MADYRHVRLDFTPVGVRLAVDIEVALLGFVHHYLAGWLARATEGTAPCPPSWPHLTYKYTGHDLRMPVIHDEVDAVIDALRGMLARHTRRRRPPVPMVEEQGTPL